MAVVLILGNRSLLTVAAEEHKQLCMAIFLILGIHSLFRFITPCSLSWMRSKNDNLKLLNAGQPTHYSKTLGGVSLYTEQTRH